MPVHPLSYAVAGHANVHVIGDACAVPASDGKAVPKSGHMANAEAKICADAILRTLTGEALDTNIATSSACYSPITSKTASWLSANFIYGDIFDAQGAVKGKVCSVLIWPKLRQIRSTLTAMKTCLPGQVVCSPIVLFESLLTGDYAARGCPNEFGPTRRCKFIRTQDESV